MPGTSIAIAPVKPPFVAFEVRPIEDRAATLENGGRYTTKDVDYAMVTPPGSKDRIPRRLPEWFDQLAADVAQERYPADWLNYYRARYQEWKNGHDLSVEGTHVRSWNALSPSQLQALLALNVHTVEQLADANEEVLTRLGMGGRMLKEQAKQFLLTANDLGKQATRIAELEATVAELRAAAAKPAVLVEAPKK